MNAFLKRLFKITPAYRLFEEYLKPLRLKIEHLEQRTVCFSQEGEDLILDTFFHGEETGFFVDVGSFHPIKYSNTYLFYLKGWRGINIDATPNSMENFDRLRPDDINLEQAIGNQEKILTYYMFDEPALNGFSKEISEDRQSEGKYRLTGKVELPLKRLETVLSEHLPPDRAISFLSVDVEGLDLEVLKSNNWDRYRPRMVLVETSVIFDSVNVQCPIHEFLTARGYTLVAKTFRTSFYKNSWN